MAGGEVKVKGYEVSVMQGKSWTSTTLHSAYR